MMMKNAPTTKVLYGLVHASPTFHALYASSTTTRHCILTQVRINELLAKGVDILKPAAMLEVRLRLGYRWVPEDLPEALKSLWGQLTSPRPLQLSIEHFKALRCIDHMIRWEVTPASELKCCNIPEENSPYWVYHSLYKLVLLDCFDYSRMSRQISGWSREYVRERARKREREEKEALHRKKAPVQSEWAKAMAKLST